LKKLARRDCSTSSPQLLFEVVLEALVLQVLLWVLRETTQALNLCRQQAQDQYQKYVNRYGSGMVIYWFGVVEELASAADSSITLVSELPPLSEITTLPSVPVPKL